MNRDLLNYGMHVAGKNLEIIIKCNFDDLKKKICEEIYKEFEFYVDNDMINNILICVAERLENSKFFWWRMEYARSIYLYLKDFNKVKNLDEKIRQYIYLTNRINERMF